jgi:hypothetical protein
MRAVANLDDSYIARTSELIRMEFAVRERGELCAPSSAETAEHMFATALAEKFAGISKREQPRYLPAAWETLLINTDVPSDKSWGKQGCNPNQTRRGIVSRL